MLLDARGSTVAASDLSLRTGRAFGADMSGRQLEIRPYASKYVLEVVGSILDTLRWLVVFRPQTLEFTWTCKALVNGDGLGGHIHFGRLKEGRATQVARLDTLVGILEVAGVLGSDFRERQNNTVYGRFSDARSQAYGYEYRTPPCWLHSPWKAFLILTLAKLVVHGTFMLPSYRNMRPEVAWLWIKGILADFKGLDDDARLAVVGLEHAPGRTYAVDSLKALWGLQVTREQVVTTLDIPKLVIPPVIRPTGATIEELYNHITLGEPLLFRVPAPTWTPVSVPVGYYSVMDYINTTRVVGMGEALVELYGSLDIPRITISAGEGRGKFLYISKNLFGTLPKGVFKLVEAVCPRIYIEVISTPAPYTITISKEIRRETELCKRILTCGAFPFWDIHNIETESYNKWQAKERPVKKVPRIGEVGRKVLLELVS